MMPMSTNAAQARIPITGTHFASISSDARTITAAPSPAAPARTAGTTATSVSAFWRVACIRTASSSGEPDRTVPRRDRPSTPTALARHT
jgi:hypothetical protein